MEEIPTETLLQSEIAALRYKNERLSQELKDVEGRIKSKEQTIQYQTNEIDSLKETLARVNAINSSLQKKLQDVEEQEKNLGNVNTRQDLEIQKLKHEVQHYQERVVELESQLRSVMIDREAAEQAKDHSQRGLVEFCRKIASAIDFIEDQPKTEAILKRIYDIYQWYWTFLYILCASAMKENSRYKVSLSNLKQSVESMEFEIKTGNETISRINSEKENLNQAIVSYLTTIDLLKREKDQLSAEKSYISNELGNYRERATEAHRTVANLGEQTRSLDQQILSLKDNLQNAEERASKLEKELKNFQESVAIQLSSGSRIVDPTPSGIRERIKDIQIELKEKLFGNDQLREKVGRMQETIERLEKLLADSRSKQDDALGEKATIGKRLQETEAQLTTMEILNEGLRKDKNRFMQFLEKLGSIVGLDEVSRELGFDLQTDALLARAEQLTKLEGDRLADKTATVYQLQRRLRTLKEQLEKKDLHLEMLRKKIMVLEESVKLRTSLELERDESCARAKKLMKQVERLELDLKEARVTIKDLKSQLVDSAEYKIIALERARKIEDTERKLNELELLRCKYNRKISFLKDQLKSYRDTTTQERDLHDHAFQKLSHDLNATKKSLLEASRREAQLLNLRNMIGKILGLDWSKTVVPDYELISKLEKIVQTNKEFAQVSRKLTDNIKMIPQTEDAGMDLCSGRVSEDSNGDDLMATRRNI